MYGASGSGERTEAPGCRPLLEVFQLVKFRLGSLLEVLGRSSSNLCPTRPLLEVYQSEKFGSPSRPLLEVLELKEFGSLTVRLQYGIP